MNPSHPFSRSKKSGANASTILTSTPVSLATSIQRLGIGLHLSVLMNHAIAMNCDSSRHLPPQMSIVGRGNEVWPMGTKMALPSG